MQIAADFAARGDDRDAALLAEFAAATKGARQLTWSPKLKKRYDVDTPERDEDNTPPRVVALIAGGWWDTIVKAGLEKPLLNAAMQDWYSVFLVLASAGLQAALLAQPPPI